MLTTSDLDESENLFFGPGCCAREKNFLYPISINIRFPDEIR